MQQQQQQLLNKHPVNSWTKVPPVERHWNLGFVFVAAKSNLQSHYAGLRPHFRCMMFLQEVIGVDFCAVVLTICDRWSEQHLVKLNTAALRGGWVGSVFFPFKFGASVVPLLCAALTSLTDTHCEVLSWSWGEQVSACQMSIKQNTVQSSVAFIFTLDKTSNKKTITLCLIQALSHSCAYSEHVVGTLCPEKPPLLMAHFVLCSVEGERPLRTDIQSLKAGAALYMC